MAATSASRIQFEYMMGGGPPVLVTYPEAYNSSGWDQGTPLAKDSSGHMIRIAPGGNLTSGSNVHAVAIGPMTSTADGSVTKPFILVTPQTVFSIVMSHATTASAVVQSAQVGCIYAISSSTTVTCGATNTWVADIATTDQIGAYIIANKDATGTAYGRNYFIFAHGAYSSDSPFWRAST